MRHRHHASPLRRYFAETTRLADSSRTARSRAGLTKYHYEHRTASPKTTTDTIVTIDRERCVRPKHARLRLGRKWARIARKGRNFSLDLDCREMCSNVL